MRIKFFGKFLRDERGMAAPEYGLIIALIAGATLLAMTVTGQSLDGFFSDTSGELDKATSGESGS